MRRSNFESRMPSSAARNAARFWNRIQCRISVSVSICSWLATSDSHVYQTLGPGRVPGLTHFQDSRPLLLYIGDEQAYGFAAYADLLRDVAQTPRTVHLAPHMAPLRR